MFWLAEDDCGAAQSAASRSLQSGLDLYLRLRGLQLGAHAKSGGHSSGGVGRCRRVSAWAGFSPIGPRNIRNQLLATTRDEKQQAKHRIPQFFSSLLVCVGLLALFLRYVFLKSAHHLIPVLCHQKCWYHHCTQELFEPRLCREPFQPLNKNLKFS